MPVAEFHLEAGKAGGPLDAQIAPVKWPRNPAAVREAMPGRCAPFPRVQAVSPAFPAPVPGWQAAPVVDLPAASEARALACKKRQTDDLPMRHRYVRIGKCRRTESGLRLARIAG